jgi:nitric oxide reductase large subunit
MWVPMGSMFSFIEVLPLVLLIIEAINHYRLIRAHQEFKYRLAYTYVIGAAFWNFVGAGVFGGGTLNAPLVNYYEHGTFLTLNHAHTALFGGSIMAGWCYGSFSISFRSVGRNSMRSMSMVSPMRGAVRSTALCGFGSGCGCRVTCCSPSARC